MSTKPDFSIETASGASVICGVDEVGRGPWAGPVVAAAVILDPEHIPEGLNDSKKMSAARREAVNAVLRAHHDFAIGAASVEEIDELNILQASLLAMKRAISGLKACPDLALIDGNRVPPDLGCAAQAVVKGDGRSLSIAAASVIAKVERDQIMVALSQHYPHYFWEKNAGYGTKQHSEALNIYGVTPHHRKSFKPIHNILCLK